MYLIVKAGDRLIARTDGCSSFIDLCLQDSQTDLPTRCPDQQCVVAKIDEYAADLRDGHADHFGAKGDLAFLIHSACAL